MKPAVEIGGARVFLGDCREVLKTLPDNSVDSIVTDPPYGLGFMGKEWDSFGKKGGISDEVRAKQQEKWGTKFAASAKSAKPSDGEMLAFQLWCTEWAVECLRVLKPGGHILAFGGSRTWHRLAVAVEDAGFEIRDNICWLYGSGFPKSLDVSKAIDKRGGARVAWFGPWFRKWRKDNAISQKEVAALFPSKTGNVTGCVANWELGFNMPTPAQFNLIKETFGLPFGSIAEAEREVIGQGTSGKTAIWNEAGEMGNFDLTAPATTEAQKWQGWGTALKPAFEPVVVGRKPLIGTVAENVLLWGVGGLNIDGSRIRTTETLGRAKGGWGNAAVGADNYGNFNSIGVTVEGGRWPANVVLDEFTAGLLDEQSGVSASKSGGMGATTKGIVGDFNLKPFPRQGHDDSGGASRFFYQAKASKRDRNEGLEDLDATRHADRVVEDGPGGENPRNRTNQAKQNFHPTVKPTQLMRYLIKLVTPAGGTVLDPFTGSGSTGKAALLDGYQFIGAELTEEYLPIIEGRLRWASEQEGEDDDTLF